MLLSRILFTYCTYSNFSEEKGKRKLEEKPTFDERIVETHITWKGVHAWELKYNAKAKDVATGIEAEAKHYYSKGGAKEHARTNLKAILLERGIIRKE